jgi:Leucine-rich repeat (LRR) protein
LYCDGNKLTYLPTLPPTLKILECTYNELTYLPPLPEGIETFAIANNPISEIVNSDYFVITKNNIDTVNKFRHLYYCIKFRDQFRKYLWVRVREPKIAKKYNPDYLIEHLGNNTDLDQVLAKW